MTSPIVVSTAPQNARTPSPGGVIARLEVPVFYKDLNADFAVGAEILVYDSKAVRQKIMNLLSVLPGEEMFEPFFGSQFFRRIFEPIDSATRVTEMALRFDVIDACTRFMSSEITLLHNQCTVLEGSDGESFDVHLVYIENRTRVVDTFKFRVGNNRNS